MRQLWQISKVRRSSPSRSRASQKRSSRGSWAGGCWGTGWSLAMRGIHRKKRRREDPLPVFPVFLCLFSALEHLEHLGEAACVALLGLRQRLEPLGDVVEALFARGLRHARVHGLVLVRLAGDRALQVLLGVADRLARRRVADLLEVVEVAVRVAGLAVGRLLEVAGDLGVALDVGDLREVEVAAVRLRLAGEGLLEVRMGLGIR